MCIHTRDTSKIQQHRFNLDNAKSLQHNPYVNVVLASYIGSCPFSCLKPFVIITSFLLELFYLSFIKLLDYNTNCTDNCEAFHNINRLPLIFSCTLIFFFSSSFLLLHEKLLSKFNGFKQHFLSLFLKFKNVAKALLCVPSSGSLMKRQSICQLEMLWGFFVCCLEAQLGLECPFSKTPTNIAIGWSLQFLFGCWLEVLFPCYMDLFMRLSYCSQDMAARSFQREQGEVEEGWKERERERNEMKALIFYNVISEIYNITVSQAVGHIPT